MKTIEERFEAQNGFDKESWGYEIAKEAYTTGATEQKAIMLEEASKGFEEWFSTDNGLDIDIDGFNKVDSESAEIIWQAATLSATKDFESRFVEEVNSRIERSGVRKEIELKDEANNLLSESFFKAKEEIKELKSALADARNSEELLKKDLELVTNTWLAWKPDEDITLLLDNIRKKHNLESR